MPRATISKPKKNKHTEVIQVAETIPVIEPVPEAMAMASPEPVAVASLELEPVASPKNKSKRVQKSKQPQVIAVVSANGEIQGTFTPEPRRPLIAHLPFRTTEVQFQDGPLTYDPRPPGVPEPYEADDLYTSNAELIEAPVEIKKENLPPAVSESLTEVQTGVYTNAYANANAQGQAQVKQEDTRAFRTIDTMIEYKVANETKTLPESVEAACFWCAGCFEGRPVVLPSLEERGIYKVYGNFCSLSCALSYLLNEQVDPQVRWERQALLNRMYKQTSAIHPAPPKESLAFFGGSLTHEQYRGSSRLD